MRMDEDTRQALELIALREHRTLSNVVLAILRDELERRGLLKRSA
jgi:hypothetical protein